MKRLLAVLILVFALLAVAAAVLGWRYGWVDRLLPASVAAGLATPLGDLERDVAAHPDGAVVHVHGLVTERFDVPFAEEDFFRIEDGTGGAWVRAVSGLPPKESRVTVLGELRRVNESFGPLKVRGLLIHAQQTTVH